MFNSAFICKNKFASVFALALGFSPVTIAMERPAAEHLEGKFRELAKNINLAPTNKAQQTNLLKIILELALNAILKDQMNNIKEKFDEAINDALLYCEFDLKWTSKISDMITTLNCQNMTREKSYWDLLEKYCDILRLIKEKGSNKSAKIDEFIKLVDDFRWAKFYKPVETF